MTPRLALLSTVALVVMLIGLNIVLLVTGVTVLGFLGLALLVIASPLWVTVIAMSWFSVRNAAREAALAGPDRILIPVVVQRPTVQQWRQVRADHGIRPQSYVTVVVDGETVRAYSGGARPAERLSVPRSALTGARASSTAPPRRVIPTIVLDFGRQPVELVPMRPAGMWPKPMPQADVDAVVAAIRAR